MKSLLFAAALTVALCASNVYAQCNAANGQCGAPSISNQALQAQVFAQNGLQFAQAPATSAASSAAVAPAPQQPLYLVVPPAPAAAPAEAGSVAQMAYPLYQFAAFPQGVAASSGSAAASASAAAPVVAPAPAAILPAPAAVNVAVAPAVSACASGNCGARRGLFGGGLFARRSSSRSVSISRSRVR